MHNLMQSGVIFMIRRRENRMAFAAAAAASGVSFSSGQEIVLFFTQTGCCSWIGVCFSAVLFGALCAGMCKLGMETGARSFTAACVHAFGGRWGMAAGVLMNLLNIVIMVFMLSTAGWFAMLSLPLHNAFLMGVPAVMAAALWINIRWRKRLPMVGYLTLALCVSFHICLALDPRPAPIVQSYETHASLSGSVTAAMCLAVLHGTLSAAAAAGTVVRFADCRIDPVRFGAKCGAAMMLALATANAAILCGGEKLLSLAMPMAVLAARWGKPGYYTCLAVMATGVVATLSAGTGTLGTENAACLNLLKTSPDHDKKTC